MSLVACVADCCVVLHTPLLYKLGRLHLAAAAITPPSSQLSLAERAVEEVAVLMLIVGCCRCGVDDSDGFLLVLMKHTVCVTARLEDIM